MAAESVPEEEDESYIGITLVRFRSKVSRHRLHYNVMITGEKFVIRSFVARFEKDCEEKGEMNFVGRRYLLKHSSGLLQKGTLALMCQVSSEEPSAMDVPPKTELFIQDAKAVDIVVLCQSFKDLLQNGEDHDLILKVQDKEFCAHRIVLRARSPVLETLLTPDVIEKNGGVIDVPDCQPNAFEQFLLYLYCGEVEILDAGNMLGLYNIAHKYATGYLKEKCRRFIENSLSSTNVTEVIQLAVDHSDDQLLKCATNYFVKEVNSIIRTDKWQCFLKQNPVVANELFIKATENFKV